MTVAFDEPTSPRYAHSLPREVSELVGAALLISAVVLGMFSLASGIAYGVGTRASGPSTLEIVQRCTAWASPTVSLMVLVALGAASWSVEHATSGRIRRGRMITTAAIAFAAVVAVSALVQLGSTLSLDSGDPGRIAVSEYIDEIGAAVSTLLLVGAGLVAGFRVRAWFRAQPVEAGGR